MKRIKEIFIIIIMCMAIPAQIIFGNAAEEYIKSYDDYMNSMYEKYGYSSYEEYAEDYYNPKKNSNKNNEYDEEVKSSKKKKNKKSNKNTQNNNQQVQVLNDRINHSFVGKTKEECPELDYLYHNSYYMKPRLDDFCSPSIYHYDDTKTVYYYPMIDESNYKSFIVLNCDTLSNNDISGVIYLNICQYLLNEDGIWSNDLVLSNTFRDDNEKTKFQKSYDNLVLDTALLYNFENRKSEPKPINPEWYVHLQKDNTYFYNISSYGSKFAYAMLTKTSANNFYVYNRDKVAAEQKQLENKQRLSQYGFTESTILSDAIIAFLDEKDSYLKITAQIYAENSNNLQLARQLIIPYKTRLKSYYDTALSTLMALDSNPYSGISRSDINAAKKALSEFKQLVQ